MNTLAVIPARGGSKGIHRKNLQHVGGKPLIAWTIEAANNTPSITRTIVTTEDEEIARVAREYSAEVPFMRPNELSEDNVHASHALTHALQWLKQEEDYEPDTVVLLLPTAPLRTAQHIEEAIMLHQSQDRRAIVGVIKAPLSIHRIRILHQDTLQPITDLPKDTQRQDIGPLYYVNGCIHIASYDEYIQSKTFHTETAVPYIMPSSVSIDIDTVEDLQLVNKILTEAHEKNVSK